ncbi:MAG TPA: tetratricopeptide repeat protein [Sphingomicrobium sp.]|nr:tetratricopeptide repeat protein [Sphingomicrobium sp.]
MVLTPDTPNESFLREVDENLRRDQARDFAKKYGGWLIAAVVLFLAAVGGWLYWQQYQQKQAEAQSEELTKIYSQIGAGQTKQAQQGLQGLESSGNSVVRTLALLTEAAVALDANDKATAIAKYSAVANDSHAPQPYRDVALIRSVGMQFDQMKPEDVISKLQPLTKPGEPWFGTAGELTAMAYIKLGNKAAAGKLFAAIAADNNAPPTLRSRSAQIAGTLGVDAVAPPSPSSQQE